MVYNIEIYGTHRTLDSLRQVDRQRHECDWKKSWPKASSNEDKRRMRQQEYRCDDNTFNQTTREASDRYRDTGKHVVETELADGQL